MTTAAEAQKTAAYHFAIAAAELAHNTRSEDVILLDLRDRSPVTEFFILATGTSPRQMRTVVEEIRDLGKKMGFGAWQTSGLETGRWILVDCVSVVCHVFDAESRDFYDLELLWGDCPRIDWRKELGLPPASTEQREPSARKRFAQAAGDDQRDAEEEDARLEGEDPDDEQGDADIDEEAEDDAPVVVELPDESTGSNSVEFVEVDPPARRRKRGRAVYPTPIADEDSAEENQGMHVVSARGGAEQSLDEDEQERESELAADTDVEAVSDEDLPQSRIQPRPMGGVSASLSSTLIGDNDEEEQRESHGQEEDARQGHQDEIPEAHEEAAETVTFRKGQTRAEDHDSSTAMPGQRSVRRALKNRKGYGKPAAAAPTPVNPRKARAGVVKSAARAKPKGVAKSASKSKPAKPAVKKAAMKSGPKKPAAKKPLAKKPVLRSAAKKTAIKRKPKSRK